MVELIKFEVSPLRNKKYRAFLSNGKHVDFGDKRYHQYKDNALGVYSYLDHNNNYRRERYYQRHSTNYQKFSPDWFSKTFLWS